MIFRSHPADSRPAPARAQAGGDHSGSRHESALATAAPSAEKLTSRPARLRGLDGLRGIAVLLVLIYHLLPGVLPGGMVGVDAFFVISGFLITSLLVTEWRRDGQIRLGRFWMRRLRRIVPALIVAVLVVVSLAVILRGDVLLGVRRQVIGAATLVYNWVEIAAGSSYFDQAQPLLLTNVWSLAVEEQFYVIWPFIVILIMRASRGGNTRRAALVALALSVISALAALGMALGGVSASRVYMGTDTHAFGLMLGAALALWHGHATGPSSVVSQADAAASVGSFGAAQESGPSELGSSSLRGWAGWLGAIALIVCARLGSDGSDGNSPAGTTTLWLILASLCAALVVQSFTPELQETPGPARVLGNLLELRPLRWLGERSYGLYLWHWPLWVLAFYAAPRDWNPLALTAGVLAASVAAAELSYHVIEVPVRRYGLLGYVRQLRSAGPIQVLMASLTTTALVLFVVMAFALQPRHSTAEEVIEAGASALASAQAAPTGGAGATAEASPAASAQHIQVSGDQVSLVGDSVSLASANGLSEALPGIAIDAKVSRSFYAAVPTLEELDAQYGKRPYVVVSLVTNGTVTTEQLDGLLDYLGSDRKLVLVTGYGPARTTWIPGANEELRSFAQQHPGQVAIADWNTAIADHTDLLAQDQVHPGEEGGKIYAQAVSDALDEVANTPVPPSSSPAASAAASPTASVTPQTKRR